MTCCKLDLVIINEKGLRADTGSENMQNGHRVHAGVATRRAGRRSDLDLPSCTRWTAKGGYQNPDNLDQGLDHPCPTRVRPLHYHSHPRTRPAAASTSLPRLPNILQLALVAWQRETYKR